MNKTKQQIAADYNLMGVVGGFNQLTHRHLGVNYLPRLNVFIYKTKDKEKLHNYRNWLVLGEEGWLPTSDNKESGYDFLVTVFKIELIKELMGNDFDKVTLLEISQEETNEGLTVSIINK